VEAFRCNGLAGPKRPKQVIAPNPVRAVAAPPANRLEYPVALSVSLVAWAGLP
jgi:hypothetical protein